MFSLAGNPDSYRQKSSLHGKRITVMDKDSAFLRDMIKSIDSDNPIGRAGPLTHASRLRQLVERRKQHEKHTRAFDKTVIEKRRQGLHPWWNRYRRFLGWRDEPMDVIPRKRIPWWEDKLTEYPQYKASDPATF